MKITRFDNYMDGEVISISIIITDITESDKRLFNKLYELLRKFRYDLEELIK